jgi:hypothetical protein
MGDDDQKRLSGLIQLAYGIGVPAVPCSGLAKGLYRRDWIVADPEPSPPSLALPTC